MKKKYTLPYQKDTIHFDAIWEHQRNYISSMGNLDSYWLVIGNGHACCRLYVSCGDDGEGVKQKAWLISYFFTKKIQENTHDAEKFPS